MNWAHTFLCFNFKNLVIFLSKRAVHRSYRISALLGTEKARTAAGSIYVTGSFRFSAVPMATLACLCNAL